MKSEQGQDVSQNIFFRSGRRYMKKQRRREREWRRQLREQMAEVESRADEENDIMLLEGKIKREELKEEILAYVNAMAVDE